MRRLSNLPIRWRLSILYGGVVCLILVIFSTGVYIYFRNSLEKSIDTKIKSIADVIASSMAEVHDPTVFGNFERYLENVLGRKPKGKLIQIIDSSGRIGAKSSDIEGENISTSFGTLERALSGITVYETVEKARPRLRMLTMPIVENRKVTSIVQVGSSLEDFDETMLKLLIALIVGVPTSVSLTVGVGYFMAKKALRPVDKIRKTAVKISSQNLDEYIDIGRRRDEIGKLAQTFNEMISRLKEAFQQINQFSIDVSHELKTPLTILKGGTEVALRKERSSDEYKALLSSHLEEIDRMSSIIDDLLLLSKADTGKMEVRLEELDLRDLIVQVYMDMKSIAEKKSVDLLMGDLCDTKLKGDELKLRRMLWNIVDNGIKYTPTGGSVEISSALDNGSVSIDVRDTGAGIADEDIKHIFDRFYRADRARNRETGTGLGLSISKWIAEAHRGTIEVESSPSSGSVFSVKLPVSGGNA